MREEAKANENDGLLPFLRQTFITAGVSFNIMGHGCVLGLSAVLIPSLRLPGSHIHATTAQESWIASIIGFSLIIGNIITTPLIDILGRKKSQIVTLIPMLIGWYSLILAESFVQIIIARFLQGLAMGLLGGLGSIIIGEMTDPKYRGSFLTFASLSIAFGVFITHTIGNFLSWQMTALVCSFTAFISLIIVLYSPESPSWLLSKGRIEESREVFYYLRGSSQKQIEELEIMIRAQALIRKSSVAGMDLPFRVRVRRGLKYFRETLVKPEFYKPIIIMSHLYTLFQFSGINLLNAYMSDIITQLAGDGVNVKFWMITLGIERLVATLISIYLIGVLNRRTLLFGSCIMCIVSYCLKASYAFLKQKDLLPFDYPWIPMTLISVYLFSISVGMTTIPSTIGGELIPLEYRGLGSGISVLSLSLHFFVALKCFPVLVKAVGLPLTYIIYASVVLFNCIVLYYMLPETKGKTLQEIEDGFRGKGNNERKASEPLNSDVRHTLEATSLGSQILY